jgi:methylated-DNA-[protein]-cysteine S-methyltransferase
MLMLDKKQTRLAMKDTSYYFFDTSLGVCGIAWKGSESGNRHPAVVFLQLPDANANEEKMIRSTGGLKSDLPPSYIAGIAERIRMHLNGRVQDFSDIRVDLEDLGKFTQQVLEACRNIPAGRTLSYSELARMIHRPKAARAVGQALAKNPVPLIIPCHRVLTLDGGAGGFSAPGGVETKKWILAKEGVTVKNKG